MTTSTLNHTAWQQAAADYRALLTLTGAIAADPARLDETVRAALGESGSLDDLLLQAHALWVRTFDARIDPLLEAGAYGDETAFARVWSDTVRVLPGVAALLERHRDHPAVVRAHAQHVRRIQRLLDVTLPDTWATASRRADRPRSCARRARRLRLPRVRLA